MYKLSFDGQPVYDPRGTNETDKLIIADPAVTLAVNSAGSVSFSIYPNHPLAGKITRMRGTLVLEDDNGTIFRGRILNDEATFYGAKKYTAEGALAYLNDSIVDPYAFPDDFTALPGYQAAADPSGNLVAWWLARLLDKHNAQVSPDHHIRLGTVTVKDPNNYITRENSNYSSTWETISDKLVGSALGGYLIMRYEDDGNYLDYLAELPRTNAQRVRFAENLLDIVIKGTGEDLYTAILPVGADGLTLAELPDGPLEGGLQKAGKIIFDPAAEARYGSRITRVTTWDDVTLAKNLQTKAATQLTSGVILPESISVRACDLHGVDGVTPHFRVGQYVRVESAPHGISAAYPLLEMSPNILDPASTTINLNTTSAKFTAQFRAAQVAAEQRTQSAVRAASKHFSDAISQAPGFYCTREPQPDESVIYYLHDKKTMEDSTLVMKLTAEAIGFSTDGGATYPYGFTIDGETIMHIIETEGLNADWIKTGMIDLKKLKLAGTICGIMEGYGLLPNGVTTKGIVVYGNGVDNTGRANPPYILVTSEGMRGQVTNLYSWNMVRHSFEILGALNVKEAEPGDGHGNISAEGNVNVGGGLFVGNSRAILNNGGQIWFGNEAATNVFLQGDPLYINEAGKTTYPRGNWDFSGADVSGLDIDIPTPTPDIPADVYKEVSFHGAASMSDLRVKLQNGYFYNLTDCDWVYISGYWVLANKGSG